MVLRFESLVRSGRTLQAVCAEKLETQLTLDTACEMLLVADRLGAHATVGEEARRPESIITKRQYLYLPISYFFIYSIHTNDIYIYHIYIYIIYIYM